MILSDDEFTSIVNYILLNIFLIYYYLGFIIIETFIQYIIIVSDLAVVY